jgi:hypothetical protein
MQAAGEPAAVTHVRARLAGATAPSARLPHLAAVLRAADDDEQALARSRELAFVANALLAGCSLDGHAFTAAQASEAAAATCNLGLEHRAHTQPAEHDLIAAFECGWGLLQARVSFPLADRLIAILGGVGSLDAGVGRDLVILRRALIAQRRAGTPWRAHGGLDVLATLDLVAWTAVLGLLDECPVVADALTALVQRSTSPIDSGAFTFIATAEQLRDVDAFLDRLPDLLRGS